MKLEGRKIILTGASSGLGLALAKKLESKNELILFGRNFDKNDKYGKSHSVDFYNPIVVREYLDFNQFDADSLILNAGGGYFGKFHNMSLDSDLNTINLNVSANIVLCKILIPQIIKQARISGKRGIVIFIMSHAAYIRVPNFAVYASCKAFLHSFSRTIALEYMNEPIDFCFVYPGAMATNFSARSGIPKMLSEPTKPEVVAEFIIKKCRPNALVFPHFIDRLMYYAERILPSNIFDRVITNIQKKYLTRQN